MKDNLENSEKKINALIKTNNFEDAKYLVEKSITENPKHIKFLKLASDIYFSLGFIPKSLEYEKNIIFYYPKKNIGYLRAAKLLVKMNHPDKALEIIDDGLEIITDDLKLLKFGNKVSRQISKRHKALKYSEIIFNKYPEEIESYTRFFQDKLSINCFNDNELLTAANKTLEFSNKKSFLFHESLSNTFQTTNQKIKRKIWINSFSIKRQCDSPLNQEELKTWQPFQYWSQGEPPDDVKSITKIWNSIFNSIGIPSIKLFDRQEAENYISEFCPELLIPFSFAWHYAIESDVFRIAFAQRNNCIWVDSDLFPSPDTKNIMSSLLNKPKTTLYFRWWQKKITNAFFLTPSNSTFFNTLINQGREVDFRGLSKTPFTIFKYFGPDSFERTFDVLTTIEVNKRMERIKKGLNEYSSLYDSMSEDYDYVNEHSFALMNPPFSLEYKGTKDSWQNLFN